MSRARGLRDQGYQPYRGALTPLAGRWRVIYRHALGSGARGAGVITVLAIAGLVALGWGAGLGFALRTGAAPAALAGAEGLADPGQYAYLFLVKGYGAPLATLLVALFAGAGAVADDARHGAFAFYFARPITRGQYLAGKILAVATLAALVSLGPALLLAALRIGFARDGAELTRQLPLVPAVLALGALEALLFAVPAVALSAWVRSRAAAQGAFAALVALPWIGGEILAAITRSAWPLLLSLPAQLQAVGAPLFSYRIPFAERSLPWPAALAASAAILAASICGAIAGTGGAFSRRPAVHAGYFSTSTSG